MNNKLLLIPTAAVSVALAAGSIAYACTEVQGSTKITQLGANSANCNSVAQPGDAANPQTDTGCDIDIDATTGSRLVTAEGAGARANTQYFLWFLNDKDDQDNMEICMSSNNTYHPNVKMWNDASNSSTPTAVTSDASGNIASTTRYIPHTVAHGFPLLDGPPHGTHNGTASFCWMDGARTYATEDVTILITGGNGNPPGQIPL